MRVIRALPCLLLGGTILKVTATSSVAQGAPPAVVKFEFGVRTREPKKWTGRVEVEGGAILGLTPWSIEDLRGDELEAASRSWKFTTRSGEKLVGEAVERSPDGFLLRLTDEPNAVIKVSTSHGDFQVALRDLPLGVVRTFLEGDVTGQRLPNVIQLTTPEREDDYPALAADRQGRLWAVWLSFREDADEVRLRCFEGTRWSEVEAVTPQPGDYHQPQVAVAGTGRVWVVWSANVDGNWDLYARSRGNGPWSEITRLTTDPAPDIHPALTAGPDGTLWLAWQSFPAGNGDIFLRFCEGTNWSEAVPVTTHPANDWEPALTIDRQGRVYVAWDTYRNGSYDVYCRTFTFGARGIKPLGEERPVAATDRFEAHASLACDREDRVWIAWDIGGPNWGKDYSEKKGFVFGPRRTLGPVHAFRRIGLRGLTQGRLWEPVDDLAKALSFAPFVPFVRNTNRGGTYFELPRLAVDGAGRLWLFYRFNDTGFYVHLNSTWWSAALYHDGQGWSESFLLPDSGGRNDVRVAPCVAPDGALWVAWTGDGRDFDWKQAHPGKGVKTNEVFVARLSLPPPASPLAVQEVEEKPPVVLPEAVRPAERPELVRGRERYQLVWGDFHRHTDISDCSSNVDGSLLDVYRYALDAGQLDFVAVTNHHVHQNRYDWWRTQKSADLYHVPGVLIPFYGYERSMGKGLGHRNIIHLQRGLELVYDPVEIEGANDTVRLWATLRGKKVLTIPHQLSGPWHDWRYQNRPLEPVVELFQGHRGSYEYAQSPRPRGLSPGRNKGSLWDAYEHRVKVGVIASSDHMSTHVSYAGVYTQEVSREGIFAALHARRTFAATDKIRVDFRLGEALLGEETTVTGLPQLRVKILGTGEIEEVVIVRNNRIIYTRNPGRNRDEFLFVDRTPLPGESYYYVRVRQRDQNMAWSSPIWVRREAR
ncbi:MAG TPA: DUF3604 domain-containing protein [Armatimonadetes bacterium]|nr:DUF3604 domain-containing protein [Armatimonadota bacterium]